MDESAKTHPPSLPESDRGDGLRELVVYSLLAGACPFIPVPLLDDWVLDRVRRRLVTRLAVDVGYSPPPPALGVLADRDPTDWRPEALARGCLRKIFVTPFVFVYKRILRKLLRKILFVLAIKDAVDEFSTTFHHGWLMRHAFASGHRPTTSVETWTLRRHVDAVRDEIDPRPVESTVRSAFRHSRRVLRKAARIVAKLGRRFRRRGGSEGAADDGWVDEAAQQAEAEAGGLVDELIAGLRREQGYLGGIALRLDRRLVETGAQPSP